jgi:hypothetical protein
MIPKLRICFNSLREEHFSEDRNVGFALDDGPEIFGVHPKFENASVPSTRRIYDLAQADRAFARTQTDLSKSYFSNRVFGARNWCDVATSSSLNRTIGADVFYLLANMERHASLELRAAPSLDAGGLGLLEAAVSPEDALPRAKLDLKARPIHSAIGA